MPLQNRVLPSGEIVADPARGTMMGNRGGRIHDPATQMLLPRKRWYTRQWLCCQVDFNNRQRTVMGTGYTELFFLDEVTALAAGHRPCFECRRKAFLDFAERWRRSKRRSKRPTADQMDETLNEQRLHDGEKRVHRLFWNDLPTGAVIAHNGGAVAKRGNGALVWSPSGYEPHPDPQSAFSDRLVSCLTPPITLAVLKTGYKPQWHPSADV